MHDALHFCSGFLLTLDLLPVLGIVALACDGALLT